MRYHEVLQWYDKELRTIWAKQLVPDQEKKLIDALARAQKEKLDNLTPEPQSLKAEMSSEAAAKFALAFAKKFSTNFAADPSVEEVLRQPLTKHWIVKLNSHKPNPNHLGGSYMQIMVDRFSGDILWHSTGGGY